MKFTLIKRKESGPWYLRVRLNGLDQKINLGTNSKREANKLAPVKYDELVRTATVGGAFNELNGALRSPLDMSLNDVTTNYLRKHGAKTDEELKAEGK